MAKTIPCFICKIACEVRDEKALAKLCEEHDTDKNRQTMINTPVHQLLNILNDGVRLQVEDNKIATEAEIQKLKDMIASLESKLTQQSTETIIKEVTKEVESTPTTGSINEYGEIV